MGTLNCRHKLKTHIKSKIKITFKMHGFQPHNMFHMVNTMMNDPEFKNLAKNFEEQMKNSMEEFKKSQTKETQKPTESSCSSSSPKTTENSCSEQKKPKIQTKLCFNSIAKVHPRTGSTEHE